MVIGKADCLQEGAIVAINGMAGSCNSTREFKHEKTRTPLQGKFVSQQSRQRTKNHSARGVIHIDTCYTATFGWVGTNVSGPSVAPPKSPL